MITVAAGAPWLSGGVAGAAPAAIALGRLSFDPPAGTNLTVGAAKTSGACNTGGDAAFLDVIGPADSPFPPGNPYNITTNEQTDYSRTGPFTVPFGVSLQTAANDRGKPLTAGKYNFTVHCIDSFTQHDFGTFTGMEIFTNPRTYNTGSAPRLRSPSLTPSQPESDSRPANPGIAGTTPTTSASDAGGLMASPEPSDRAHRLAVAGAPAGNRSPIVVIGLGSLILVAATLVLVVWRKRVAKAASNAGRRHRR